MPSSNLASEYANLGHRVEKGAVLVSWMQDVFTDLFPMPVGHGKLFEILFKINN